MNIETLVLLGVVYAIGLYATAFAMGMVYEKKGMEFKENDWFMCLCWPVYILVFAMAGAVVWVLLFCDWAFSRLNSRFPAMVNFVQRMWKCIRTAIFAVSLLFRPAKFGEVVGKLIFGER